MLLLADDQQISILVSRDQHTTLVESLLTLRLGAWPWGLGWWSGAVVLEIFKFSFISSVQTEYFRVEQLLY